MRDPLEGVSPDGTIVTGARRDRVPPHFEPVLAAAGDLMAAQPVRGSLYLYGSVATGRASTPSSDVDLLAIDVDPDTTSAAGRTLTEWFRDRCRAVEIAPSRSADLLGDTDEAYGLRVFLRHYCVHVSGPACHASLPDFTADARAARGFNGDIAIHANRWRTALAEGGDHTELARRVARKTLLAVAGLVSVHDHTWTTDRTDSARRWAEIQPELGSDLPALVAWIDGFDVPTRGELVRTLDEPVDALTRTFASTVGLWS